LSRSGKPLIIKGFIANVSAIREEGELKGWSLGSARWIDEAEDTPIIITAPSIGLQAHTLGSDDEEAIILPALPFLPNLEEPKVIGSDDRTKSARRVKQQKIITAPPHRGPSASS
jgi:hypothetical protein